MKEVDETKETQAEFRKRMGEWYAKRHKFDQEQAEWFKETNAKYKKIFQEVDAEAEKLEKTKVTMKKEACKDLKEEAKDLKYSLIRDIAATGLAISEIPVLPHTASYFALAGAGKTLNTAFSLYRNKQKQEVLNCKFWNKESDLEDFDLNNTFNY